MSLSWGKREEKMWKGDMGGVLVEVIEGERKRGGRNNIKSPEKMVSRVKCCHREENEI